MSSLLGPSISSSAHRDDVERRERRRRPDRRVPPPEHEAPVEACCPPASMPSMRQSYTVTVPEEPPAAAFPFLKQEIRRKGSMSGSVLVSTFVGLLINQAKVRGRKAPRFINRENYSRFVLLWHLWS
ncbi:hypothetical protein GOODEAATRI_016578 [Goodea atripinnis]|uniref:Uncharacterized protein n=1 Tax=Goodea atripinnis TaxID=208336 RepID=A0ABV0NB55_9TELE